MTFGGKQKLPVIIKKLRMSDTHFHSLPCSQKIDMISMACQSNVLTTYLTRDLVAQEAPNSSTFSSCIALGRFWVNPILSLVQKWQLYQQHQQLQFNLNFQGGRRGQKQEQVNQCLVAISGALSLDQCSTCSVLGNCS